MNTRSSHIVFDMPVYNLVLPGAEVLRPHAANEERTVHVEGDDLFGARSWAFQDAIERGERTVGIIVNGTHVLRRSPQSGATFNQTEMQLHGMWLYLERLAMRYGHVYAAPLSAMRGIPSYGEVNSPTIPLVAAYQVAALKSLPEMSAFGVVGQMLCSRGYDSYTVGDYFTSNLNRRLATSLEETGTVASWRSAYHTYIARNL